MSRRIAHEVVVDQVQQTVTIDGHPFPYYLTHDVTVDGGLLPVVRLGLLADNVRLITSDAGEVVYSNPWPTGDGSTDTATDIEGHPCC